MRRQRAPRAGAVGAPHRRLWPRSERANAAPGRAALARERSGVGRQAPRPPRASPLWTSDRKRGELGAGLLLLARGDSEAELCDRDNRPCRPNRRRSRPGRRTSVAPPAVVARRDARPPSRPEQGLVASGHSDARSPQDLVRSAKLAVLPLHLDKPLRAPQHIAAGLSPAHAQPQRLGMNSEPESRPQGEGGQASVLEDAGEDRQLSDRGVAARGRRYGDGAVGVGAVPARGLVQGLGAAQEGAKAKIPEEVEFRTKPQLGVQLSWRYAPPAGRSARRRCWATRPTAITPNCAISCTTTLFSTCCRSRPRRPCSPARRSSSRPSRARGRGAVAPTRGPTAIPNRSER
jgi:hypothetical protein